MGKIAFVFSGQGDQYVGMGKDIYEKYPCAAKIFDSFGIADLCFKSTEEALKETKNTQPCLFALESAYCEVLREHGIIPSAVAGFSLGEITALSQSGLCSTEDGFAIVKKRGELMQTCAERYDTAMAAVVKLSHEKVEEICREFSDIYPVNYNCPNQTTVSGLSTQLSEFSARVKNEGGRAIPLKVKGAFHSPFMKEASEGFGKFLNDYTFGEQKIPLYSNVTGKIYDGDVKSLLSRQISSPVRWEDIIKNMISDGIDTFIEIGPGKTLTNMTGKISNEVTALCVCELDELFSKVKI